MQAGPAADDLRSRLGLGSGPVLLYAAHLGPASDLASLLPALAVVPLRHPEARLLVVGDGRERRRLEALAELARSLVDRIASRRSKPPISGM